MIQVDPATVEYMLIMVGIIWVVLGLLAYICYLCQREESPNKKIIEQYQEEYSEIIDDLLKEREQ